MHQTSIHVTQLRTAPQFLYYSICDSLTHFPTRRFYFLLFLPTPFVSSAKRSSRLRLEMSFLWVYLYVCWPLASDALNRKMMYAIEIVFLWKLSVLAFSKKISIDVSWFIESISPLPWKSSESGLQTKLLAMLRLHQIAFRGCRTTPWWPIRQLSRCGPARRSTAPTTSPSSTARTSAEDPKTTKTCHSITGYHHPKNNAWYWLQGNLLPAPLYRQSHNSPRITAFRYPAQIVKVDTSGKRFDRQSAARKSLLHVQSGLHAIEDANDSSNTDSVKRRSRSRKPRGTRRNTIAGTDQKEIEGITENGFVSLIRFVCFIDFVEHGVSFAITLERREKKVPRTVFPCLRLCRCMRVRLLLMRF